MTTPAARWAVDTSVAVAALDASHEAHGPCRRAVLEHRPALAGHAAFEAHAVLTRLPLPLRLTAAQAREVLHQAFAEVCWLRRRDAAALHTEIGDLDLTGGAVYDALVGRAAGAEGRTLLTRDRRAERTYRALGVPYLFVE